MDIAYIERADSDDPKSKRIVQSGVGAVIVSDGEIIARSANVLPPKLKNYYSRLGTDIGEAERYHYIEHAERAAIFLAMTAGHSLSGTTMYCTRFPCSDCARAISWVGISRLVVGSRPEGEGRWFEAQRAARAILKKSGIALRVFATKI